jgi:Peptidase M1 N-terminal domain
MHGHVDHLFDVLENDVAIVTLDIRDLEVTTVLDQVSGTPLDFVVEKAPLGQSLQIVLAQPVSPGESCSVRVHYSTSPQASGVQWLPPSQTDGGKHPYLFTQFQAIHARSMIPCQDTPAVKAPYVGSITVPQPLTALMGALSISDKVNDVDLTHTFTFEQKVGLLVQTFLRVVCRCVSRVRVWLSRVRVWLLLLLCVGVCFWLLLHFCVSIFVCVCMCFCVLEGVCVCVCVCVSVFLYTIYVSVCVFLCVSVCFCVLESMCTCWGVCMFLARLYCPSPLCRICVAL